jgi:hypothetical protein
MDVWGQITNTDLYFHWNVNVLGRFYKHFLTSLYRSTLFDIFLKPDSNESNSLKDLFSTPIWRQTAKLECWYQGRYGKFHVIIYLSHILHLLFSRIDFYITEKIVAPTNCEMYMSCWIGISIEMWTSWVDFTNTF